MGNGGWQGMILSEKTSRFELRFPLVVIDFEATALTLESYPIEVGLATSEAPEARIEVWSTLIAPDASWQLSAQWDPDAERIHGISRWQLRAGAAATAIMDRLNALAGHASTVWCDGGQYDAHWLATLSVVANIEPKFFLRDLRVIFDADPDFEQRYRDILDRSKAPHRAGLDAERICAALIGAR